MAELKGQLSTSHPRIKLVPKRTENAQQNIVVEDVNKTEETKLDEEPGLDPSPLSPREIIANPMTSTVNSPTIEASSIISASEIPLDSHPNPSINMKKIIIRVTIVGTVILLCSAAVVVPSVLIASLQQKSTNTSGSNLPPSLCSSTTCIGSETPYRTSTITALFPFDGNANDLYGTHAGIGYGSPVPTYTPGTRYIRASLDLRSGQYQYVQISPMSFQQQSFTLEFWFFLYSSATAVDYGLFTQCSSDLICLSVNVRSGRMILFFDSLNATAKALVGGTLTSRTYWYHIAIVYDAVLRQQLMYVNGRVDAVSSGMTDPYQGATLNANTYVGVASSVNYTSSYVQGIIDHLTVSIGVARTACQISNDATLFVYYPFDTIDTWLDRSVNLIHGYGASLTTVLAGRVQQAIAFQSSTSYFQALGFPTLYLVDLPFSVVLWVKPSVIVGGGSLVHVSSFQNGTGPVCYDFLGFTASGMLVAQLMNNTGGLNNIQGTMLPLNTWSHIAVIYSVKNGFRLYVNGQLIASFMTSIFNTNVNIYITLGNSGPGFSVPSSACLASPAVFGSYQGAIDEFRFYTRELNMDELCVLVNV